MDLKFRCLHGTLSAGYAGVIALLFALEIYRTLVKRKLLVAGIVTVSAALVVMMDEPTVPMATVLGAFFSDALIITISTGFNVLLAFLAVSFLVCFSIFLWRQRMDRFTRLTGSTALVGIFRIQRSLTNSVRDTSLCLYRFCLVDGAGSAIHIGISRSGWRLAPV